MFLFHKRSLSRLLCESEEAAEAEEYVLAAILHKYVGAKDLPDVNPDDPDEGLMQRDIDMIKRRKETDQSYEIADYSDAHAYPGMSDEQIDAELDASVKYNIKHPEILSPALLQKVHSFFGGMVHHGRHFYDDHRPGKTSKTGLKPGSTYWDSEGMLQGDPDDKQYRSIDGERNTRTPRKDMYMFGDNDGGMKNKKMSAKNSPLRDKEKNVKVKKSPLRFDDDWDSNPTGNKKRKVKFEKEKIEQVDNTYEFLGVTMGKVEEVAIPIARLPESPKETEPEKDWRIENIWMTSGNAEVDINILWTNYSSVSFLGNMDRESGGEDQNETMMWHFHVKKNSPPNRRRRGDQKEKRLFNVKDSATEIFGKSSAFTSREVKSRIKQIISTATEAGFNATNEEREGLANNVLAYINRRLLGNHWKIDVSSDLRRAECTKLNQTAGDEAKLTRLNRSSWRLQTPEGDQFTIDAGDQITSYKSKKEDDELVKNFNDPAHDVDDEYWKEEIKEAQNAKFLYLFYNGSTPSELEKEYNFYDFLMMGDAQRFTTKYLKQQGILRDLDNDERYKVFEKQITSEPGMERVWKSWSEEDKKKSASDDSTKGFALTKQAIQALESKGFSFEGDFVLWDDFSSDEGSADKLPAKDWIQFIQDANENLVMKRHRKENIETIKKRTPKEKQMNALRAASLKRWRGIFYENMKRKYSLRSFLLK